MRLNSFSESSFLLRRTSATYDTWHFHSIQEKVFTSFFILKYICKSFSINDQNSIEVLFDFFPFRFPNLCVSGFLNFYVGLCDILKSTRSRDTLSSLNFITCNHPDFDVGTFESFNGIF